MDFEWMGRYRSLVSEVMRLTNVAVKDSVEKHDIGDGILVNNTEWQILEYIVEHRFDEEKMILISDKLGITQGAFSKAAKKLTDFGLLERYQKSNNKKDIILKPTDKAISIYMDNVENVVRERFLGFFSALDDMDDSGISAITYAFAVLNNDIEKGIVNEKKKKEEKVILVKKK